MRAASLAAALALAAVHPAAGNLIPGAVYTWRVIGRPCASYLTGQTPCDSHRVFYADTVTPDSYWQLLAGDSPGEWRIKQSGGRGGRIVHCNNNRMYLGVEQNNLGQAAACKKFVQTYRIDAKVFLEPTGNGPMQYNIIPTSHVDCVNFRAVSANPCDVDDWATMASPSNPADPAYSDFQLTCVEGCTPVNTVAPIGAPVITAAPTEGKNTVFTEEPSPASDAPTVATDAPTVATDAPTVATDAPTAATDAPTAATDAPTAATHAPTAATDAPTGSPITSSPSMSPTVDCNHPSIIRLESPVPVHSMAIVSTTQQWLEGPAPQTHINLPKAQGAIGRWLQGGQLFALNKQAKCFPKGQNLTIECRSDICDVYVFLYHQPPSSGATNGDLVATLPNGGWTPGGRCAPAFWHQSEPSCKHRMLAFRKRLSCEQTAEISVDQNKPAAYMAIAAVRGVDCSDNSRAVGSEECTALPPTRGSNCQWIEGQCQDMWCPPLPPQQPNPGSNLGTVCSPPDLACE